jgi:hypothetical protein
MNFLIEIILLVCLCCELKCLEIKNCSPSQKIFISLQNTPLVIGCETDKALSECTLKKNNHPDQSCTYHSIWHVVWSWVVKSCNLQNIVSKSNSYKCEFSLPYVSLSGKRWHFKS